MYTQGINKSIQKDKSDVDIDIDVALQCGSVQCSIVNYVAVQCSEVKCSIVQCREANAVMCNSGQFKTVG